MLFEGGGGGGAARGEEMRANQSMSRDMRAGRVSFIRRPPPLSPGRHVLTLSPTVPQGMRY